MRDLDQLLTPDVAARAADAATPDFDAAVARGRARGRRRAAVAAAGTVLVVAGVGGLALGLGPQRSAPQPADPSPSPSPSRTEKAAPSPEEIVDDPRATVSRVVTAPGNPDVRAVRWFLCERPRCRTRHEALALTDDGFATRTLVELPERAWTVLPAGPESFLVPVSGGPWLLDLASGRKVALDRPDDAGPVRAGEVVSDWRGGGAEFYAFDPATGRTHWVKAVDGTRQLQARADGSLESIARPLDGKDAEFLTSEDGGESWSGLPLTAGAGDTSLYALVPSADPSVRAVVGGADGATLFPFIDVTRFDRSTGTSQRFVPPADPRAYVGEAAVLPDGRLLVDVVGWSDDRPGKPSARPHGPYVSNGDDWSDLRRLVPGAGSGLAAGERDQLEGGDLGIVGLDVTERSVTAYLSVGGTGASSAVYAVTDGENWSRVAVR